MDWFERLSRNRYIEAIILANNQGSLLRASPPLGNQDEVLPSMLQALEVLAQTLTGELGCGEARMVHISTEQGHLMLFPLIGSTYYLAVMVELSAPLALIMIELDRTLRDLRPDDLAAYEVPFMLPEEADDLDAREIIEAVQDWLKRRPPADRG